MVLWGLLWFVLMRWKLSAKVTVSEEKSQLDSLSFCNILESFPQTSLTTLRLCGVFGDDILMSSANQIFLTRSHSYFILPTSSFNLVRVVFVSCHALTDKHFISETSNYNNNQFYSFSSVLRTEKFFCIIFPVLSFSLVFHLSSSADVPCRRTTSKLISLTTGFISSFMIYI